MDQERRVLDIYKQVILYILRRTEAKTTLEEDLQMLCDPEQKDWQLRTALIYRSGRKKILHSQLHLVTWLQHVLAVCD